MQLYRRKNICSRRRSIDTRETPFAADMSYIVTAAEKRFKAVIPIVPETIRKAPSSHQVLPRSEWLTNFKGDRRTNRRTGRQTGQDVATA